MPVRWHLLLACRVVRLLLMRRRIAVGDRFGRDVVEPGAEEEQYRARLTDQCQQ